MSRWRKFRALNWSDRSFLLYAVVGLPVAGLILRLAGFERSIAWLRRSSPRAGKSASSKQLRDWAQRRAFLISAAARSGPYRATCLPRSFLLWWITRRRGLEPELKIGVRRDRGALLAHAWIELDGEVLNDRAEVVRSYSSFDAGRLPDEVSWC
ncbi:MAG: lasso peptide biosynthesis B2 protein [bacterium]|nr:lasso peptide biosynthesis B2 protein [bacterium]